MVKFEINSLSPITKCFLRPIHLHANYDLILLHDLLWNIFGVIMVVRFFIQQHIIVKNDLGSKWRTIENVQPYSEN